MMKSVMVPMLLVLFTLGCSQQTTTSTWNAEQARVLLPEVQSLTSVITQQALAKQSAEVKQAVNTVSADIYDVLGGQLKIDAARISTIVSAAVEKAKLSNQLQGIVKPIVTSVLLIGLQSIEQKINAAGQDLANNNALIVDFVRAAAAGIRDGSAVQNPEIKGDFIIVPR